MAISDWRPDERPRERLLAHGAKALSDAELVAILLRTGVRGKSAVDLAREILQQFGGVAGMLGADLVGIKGLGPAKSAQFVQVRSAFSRNQRWPNAPDLERYSIQQFCMPAGQIGNAVFETGGNNF